MQLVCEHVPISTPRIHNLFFDDRHMYIVMDYVDGEDLITLWPKLSLWRKLYVVWTIRRYIQKLRAWRPPKPDIPGPIDASGEPVDCECPQFGEWPQGPFANYSELCAWFEHVRALTVDMAKHRFHHEIDEKNLPHFDRSTPLVFFIHGDISMRNIRVSKDGTVWLLDWGFSGMYPQWFEYVGMMKYRAWIDPHPWLWMFCIPFMAGWYHKQASFLDKIRIGLQNPFWRITPVKAPDNRGGE
ncbi:hypothetical protein DACRYDRAFT_54027 [Dacryopinax primogenitus]|uniref:Aminoglycoside phosphotransferase domain-containing protein n=1 Tax=Dacryopinax primogenitus (strain DJM 731) TaxID=1858805 RepID=M5G9P1_DACPD|nr:uncharacterized protein DACRYDRAFT_54027 [Dacryopinax primogenitus]EJU00538.1 hypothetical protein DACRYDRAFT_54027 [Dacryopinax primogenitus]